MRVHPIGALLAAALLAGCGPGQRAAAPPETSAPTISASPPAAPPPAPTPTTGVGAAPPGDLRLSLAPFVDGFAQPTYVTSAGDGSGRLFVTEQEGRIWAVRDGARLAEPFLDLVDLVGSRGNEQGLLSIAFHPRFAQSGLLYVNYTDRQGDTVVARYAVSADDPGRADPASAAVLLTIPQPAANHNGGLLTFGPDGYLYIGMGDGGAAGDPWGNAQNLDSLLGKLLRIDVDRGDPYAVPADNPFVGQAGARPEIWALGLRNPWRFSFDRATGDLYIADVGQNEYEEVNRQPAASRGGENYGWDIAEGTACYGAETCDQAGLTRPIAVYSHASDKGGCSVTGGHVYRGAAYPQLAGTYLYADYCTGNLWALRGAGDAWQSDLVATLDIRPSSFGEDEAGELYLTDHSGGGLYRLVAG